MTPLWKCILFIVFPLFGLGVWGLYETFAMKKRRGYSDWEWERFQPGLRFQRLMCANFIGASVLILIYVIIKLR